MKIALVGHSGFIGSEIARALRTTYELVDVKGLHVSGSALAGLGSKESVEAWLGREKEGTTALLEQLDGCEVVINAAGLARPDSPETGALFDANVVLPGVISRLAAEAGVRRLVHISSAAVQGRRDPLDESETVDPHTPYARSKAAGERLLLKRRSPGPPELVVYRPTSVQGASRGVTRQLIRVASLPVVPMVGNGSRPVPLALVENVAAGVAMVTTAPNVSGVILQPWEGVTIRRLWELLGNDPRLVRIPRSVARVAVGGTRIVGRWVPRIGALGRRVELLAYGQCQEATVLARLGFSPPLGMDSYRELADRIRSEVAGLNRDRGDMRV